MDAVKQYMGIAFILIFIYLVLKDAGSTDKVITSISNAATSQISTLQGN